MKTISIQILTAIVVLFLNLSAKAQPTKTIEPYRLDISNTKTTNIVFAHAIVSVDRGTRDVWARKAKGVENILQVKAANDSIGETNLTVVTADGKLSSFVVNYSRNPSELNVSMVPNVQLPTIFLSPDHVNLGEIQSFARLAGASKNKIGGIKDKAFGIRFQMDGLFINDEVLYCRIKLLNSSNISYTIDQLRFFIRDQRKAKRTATQEIEVKPIHIEDNTDKVKAGEEKTIVFALPKFTIPDKKFLTIQLMELNGGRHLEMSVKNRTLIRASVLQK